jgi:hypothetical protein
VRPFSILFLTGLAIGLSGYLVFWTWLEWLFTFGALYRMFMYQLEHPVPYVVLVSAAYASLGSAWLRWRAADAGWRRRIGALLVLVLAIVVSSGPGGFLWVYHDMCAGYFLTGHRLVDHLIWGFDRGLRVGPILVLTAVPMNVIAGVLGYGVLVRLAERRDEARAAID